MNIVQVQHHYELEGLPAGITCAMAGRESITFKQDGPLEDVRAQEKQHLSTITGLPPENHVFLQQVHGDAVINLDSYPLEEDLTTAGEADAMITSKPGICPVIRTADCVPVMLYDPVNRTLGMVHSGWRGAQLDIVGKTIAAMGQAYGTRGEALTVAVLPSIGPEQYEVQDDVASHFPDAVHPAGERFLLNLWTVVHLQLLEQGVNKENIFHSRICTLTSQDQFFTHRGGDTGRNLNIGFMVDG